MIKLEKLSGIYTVLTNTDKSIGTFELDIDGSYYFWIAENSSGCWTSHILKKIAEKLDEVNKPFDEEVSKYFNTPTIL